MIHFLSIVNMHQREKYFKGARFQNRKEIHHLNRLSVTGETILLEDNTCCWRDLSLDTTIPQLDHINKIQKSELINITNLQTA